MKSTAVSSTRLSARATSPKHSNKNSTLRRVTTGVPVDGLPVLMTNYRFADTGFQVVKVDNYQARLLGGLRGEWRGFDWETALLYSEAEAEDVAPGSLSRAAEQSPLLPLDLPTVAERPKRNLRVVA